MKCFYDAKLAWPTPVIPEWEELRAVFYKRNVKMSLLFIQIPLVELVVLYGSPQFFHYTNKFVKGTFRNVEASSQLCRSTG